MLRVFLRLVVIPFRFVRGRRIGDFFEKLVHFRAVNHAPIRAESERGNGAHAHYLRKLVTNKARVLLQNFERALAFHVARAVNTYVHDRRFQIGRDVHFRNGHKPFNAGHFVLLETDNLANFLLIFAVKS